MKFNKHTDENFTIIRNDVLQDKNLSWKAKGIFVYLWSQKDDWTYYQSEVVKHAKGGRDSLSAGLDELQEFGYLSITRNRDEKGHLKEPIWDLYPIPSTFSPKPENPTQGKPTQGNAKLTSTNNNKNLLKEPSCPKSKIYDEQSPYYKMAKALSNLIKQNDPSAKKHNLQKWADDMRKLVELDKRTDKNEIWAVMNWCQNDSFWSTNILSAAKFRKQYPQLKLKMAKEESKGNPLEPPMSDEARKRAEEAKRLQERIEAEKESSAKEREAG